MATLGVFAEAFGYTPDEYRGLTFDDHNRLVKYLEDKQRKQNFLAKAREHFRR